MEEKIKCTSCGKQDDTVKSREIKENGVVGYYDVTVMWCGKCVDNHNKNLLSNWG